MINLSYNEPYPVMTGHDISSDISSEMKLLGLSNASHDIKRMMWIKLLDTKQTVGYIYDLYIFKCFKYTPWPSSFMLYLLNTKNMFNRNIVTLLFKPKTLNLSSTFTFSGHYWCYMEVLAWKDWKIWSQMDIKSRGVITWHHWHL